jgi:peptidoglycan/LPS O-acetylase OafA/YrhL
MSEGRSSVARGFIPELDGLRGIAILLVMTHRFWPRHGIGVAADAAGAGWIGVDLFFVVSGFLIAGILLDTRGEGGYFRNFYARRVLRIFPLYYVFVIGVLLAFAGNAEFREHSGSPLWYLAHLGNVPEGLLGLDVPYWLAPVWSLAIEEQFYLTFPWLVHYLDRRRLTIVLVAMIICAPGIRMLTTVMAPDHERVQYLFTLCRIDTIAVGCLLAVIVRSIDLELWRDRAMKLALLGLPGVTVLAIASRLDRTSPFDRVFGYSIVAVGCASVVALVLLSRGRRSTAVLRIAPLRYLGKLCFGLYLLHRPADTLVSALASRAGLEGDLWLMPLKIGVAVVLATASWRILEQPFLALKDRFTSERHPRVASSATPPIVPGFLVRALRHLGLVSLVVLLGTCQGDPIANREDASAGSDGDAAAISDAAAVFDAPGDGNQPVTGTLLYPEGPRHSPITPALVTRLQTIAATSARRARVFAKVGDSITVADDFLHCFDGGAVDLGAHGHLAPTIELFLGGDAAGTSPFARTSIAAQAGSTASDVLVGSPCPFDREVATIDPRIAVVLFGTNEVRYAWSVAEFGRTLWRLVDEAISRGVVPIMSTIPANPGYPDADARIPTFNRVVRAIAQGRGVPFVDLHGELMALPGRGISQDGLHPSTAPGGACVLTSAGLQYGYNVRNLITVEALARTRAALTGTASDASAPARLGTGHAGDPFAATLPLVDLQDTRSGDSAVGAYGCGGPLQPGHELVYRLDLATARTIDAHVIARPGVDVDVHILAGSTAPQACVASGDTLASATVGPGLVYVIVDARLDGEYLLVVEAR